MEEDPKLLIISLFVAIVAVGGLIYYSESSDSPEEEIVEINDSNWCTPGNNIILDQDQEISTEGGQTFEVKGNITYEGKDVCQTEYVDEEGTLIQYFTKNKDYVKLVYKNSSGDIINELEMNQTGFETNYGETVYNDTNYEVSVGKTN